MFRLVKVPNSFAAIKYFVYVTDSEMAGYFGNPANRLADLFDVSGAGRFVLGPSVFQGFSKTFVTGTASLACDCQVEGRVRSRPALEPSHSGV